MSDLAEAMSRDDDTGRIREILRDEPSDPNREIAGLRIAMDLHERADRKAIRIALALLALIAAASITAATIYISGREESVRTVEQLDRISRDVARIDARLERLDDRISRSE